MPTDNTIALQAKAPDAPNLLQMATQAQQYKYLNANTNQLQQAMGANQAVSRAIQNRTGADGKVDLAGVQADLSQDPNAAYNLQATTGTNLDQQGKQTSNSSTQLALTTDMVQHITQNMGQLLSKPNPTHQDVVQNLIQAGKQFNIPDDVIAGSIARFPQTNDPAQIKQEIDVRLQQFQAPAAQANAYQANPTAVSTGGSTQFVNTNPRTNAGQPGSVGSSLPNTLAPGQLETATTDSNQNPIVVQKNPQGQVTAVKGAPMQGTPTFAPNVIPPGESPDSMNALRTARTTTNTAAAKVPELHTYNDNIIRIASDPVMMNPHTFASASAEKLRQLGFTPGTDYKTALDQIGHNIALTTQANEASMGVSTDAGRKTSELASGSTQMNIPALINATKMNDATATGLDAFNRGQEAAIKAAGNNPVARRDFQNSWSKVYSPVVMQLYNAAKKGDTAEQQSIMQEMGYKGPIAGFWKSPQGALLLQKAQAMEKLTKTGSL